jgi:hypothetical protein
VQVAWLQMFAGGVLSSLKGIGPTGVAAAGRRLKCWLGRVGIGRLSRFCYQAGLGSKSHSWTRCALFYRVQGCWPGGGLGLSARIWVQVHQPIGDHQFLHSTCQAVATGSRCCERTEGCKHSGDRWPHFWCVCLHAQRLYTTCEALLQKCGHMLKTTSSAPLHMLQPRCNCQPSRARVDTQGGSVCCRRQVCGIDTTMVVPDG